MYIQWCLKGIAGIDQTEADAILEEGLISNWMRNYCPIDVRDIPRKLTDYNLNIHVNNYDDIDHNGTPYSKSTPFISLTAGAMERNKFLMVNHVHSALQTALIFATNDATEPGYIFYCWVPVALNRAVAVESVAEEVRELNTYRSFSAYQLEGEVTAKLRVPASQVHRWERYRPGDGDDGTLELVRWQSNPLFAAPDPILNYREAF